MNQIKTISKNDLNNFINKLIQDKNYEVVGVKSKDKRYVFDQLENASELRLDHDVTIIPPKKYFLPQYETLMKYDLEKQFEVKPNMEIKPRIIIGIHPYDVIALEQMDKVYLDSQTDDFYKKRREVTIIIASDIQNVSECSFAASMNTNTTDKGFDLLLTNIETKYAITIGSEKGKRLLEKYAKTEDAKEVDIKKIDEVRKKTLRKYKKKVILPKEEWSSVLVANYDSGIWEERSDRCIECSSCTMVCPTCYCYDVKDEVSLNLKTGNRIRTWDGCLLKDFTKVGSGEVFREEIKDRYRHRFFRKGNYLHERYGFVACVGCGRCSIACLPDIADPSDVINSLSHHKKSDDTSKFFIKQETKIAETNIIHMPRKATIKRIEKLTDAEKLFEIELDDKKPLGGKPGQFVEVSIFGVGEAPFGLASPPSDSPSFEIAVRKVGNVTSKLHKMSVGDKIGIRGPFGNGFDVKAMEGKNLMLTAGGIGMYPMRSLINYVLDKKNRKKFKQIIILYGAKRPKEILFTNEIEEWKKCDDTVCKLTVDRCEQGECWQGDIGLITTLFPKIRVDKLDSKNTIAVVVGPPVMYKFVIKSLQTMGIPDENIFVSLERRMKCGVGKCGHCQINGVYVCKEGPVFNYKEIKNLPEAFE
ncbi:MAG: 4Fe-4S dicluster domain-containing protein [Candidatus Thermoplasmatota archaeon]|nr:4Fe-4S dicluster domain-containing protein [Candidatus Thermoplasmatota archaeon]